MTGSLAFTDVLLAIPRSVATKPSSLVCCVIAVSFPMWKYLGHSGLLRSRTPSADACFSAYVENFSVKGRGPPVPLSKHFPRVRSGASFPPAHSCLQQCATYPFLSWPFDFVHLAAQSARKDLLGAYCLRALWASYHLLLLDVCLPEFGLTCCLLFLFTVHTETASWSRSLHPWSVATHEYREQVAFQAIKCQNCLSAIFVFSPRGSL